MAISCRTDSRGLVAKLRLLDRNRPEARREAAIAIAGEVVRIAVGIAPRDTNRYINGWVQANRAVGGPPVAAPPIRPSKVHDEIVRKLKQQVQFWEFIVRAIEQKGITQYKGPGKSGETKSYRKAKKSLARAKEQLEKVDPTSIAFGLRGYAAGSVRLTVRNKIYGGTGQVVDAGGITLVKLHNLEAHASIVEHKFKVMARAMGVGKAAGARKINNAYFRKIMVGQNTNRPKAF